MNESSLTQEVAEREAREKVIDLLSRYCDVVDEPSRIHEWPSLFAPDEASYVVTTRYDVEQGYPIAIVMDDSIGKIHDRVFIINEMWGEHCDRQSTIHTLSFPILDSVSEEVIVARTKFTVDMNMIDVAVSHRITGEYRDRIARLGSDGLAFRSRAVVLDTRVLPTYFVWPV